jgi:hypothetical protein
MTSPVEDPDWHGTDWNEGWQVGYEEGLRDGERARRAGLNSPQLATIDKLTDWFRNYNEKRRYG